MKIISPIASGSGAYIVHKMLEQGISAYKVKSYHPYLTLFPPLLRLVGFRQADIIHTSADYAIFSHKRDIPLVSTFHNFVLDKYNHQYSSLLQKVHYQTDLRLYTRYALLKSSRITAVSHYIAQLIRRELSYQGDIRVIHNGVDTDRFVPRPRAGPGKIRLLFCGNLSARKGTDIIPAILDNIADNTELLYTAGLRNTRARIKHNKAHSVGQCPYTEIHKLYHEADILLFPSYREGCPLAMTEAMSCGLPVIASDCSGIPELLDDNVGGFLCTPGATEEFAEKINRLAAAPGLRREMGEYNRAKIESRFTLGQMIKKYEALFEEVLSRPQNQ